MKNRCQILAYKQRTLLAYLQNLKEKIDSWARIWNPRSPASDNERELEDTGSYFLSEIKMCASCRQIIFHDYGDQITS